jgi:uroporphyrinogen-III synthase
MGEASLAGRAVLVTRPEDQSASLIALLRERGATAMVAPAVRIVDAPTEELDRAVGELTAGRYTWVVLTSQAGVEALFGRLPALGAEPGTLPARVAAVGAGTASALAERGVRADLVPSDFTTEALGAAMPEGTGRVLLARADIAPEGLEGVLEAKGWTTDRVTAYRTELAEAMPPEARTAFEEGALDAITFTSASTVRGFQRMTRDLRVPAGANRPAVVCIGPVTAREAEREGLVVDAVADPHTIEGLVAALEGIVGRPGQSTG